MCNNNKLKMHLKKVPTFKYVNYLKEIIKMDYQFNHLFISHVTFVDENLKRKNNGA